MKFCCLLCESKEALAFLPEQWRYSSYRCAACCAHQLMKTLVRSWIGQASVLAARWNIPINQCCYRQKGLLLLLLLLLSSSVQIPQTLQRQAVQLNSQWQREEGVEWFPAFSNKLAGTLQGWQLRRTCGKPTVLLAEIRLLYVFKDPFLDYHQDIFPENFGAFTNEHGECVHYDISALETINQGKWSAQMLADCCNKRFCRCGIERQAKRLRN